MVALLKDISEEAPVEQTVVKKRSPHKRFKADEDFLAPPPSRNGVSKDCKRDLLRKYFDSERQSREFVPVWRMTADLSGGRFSNVPHEWACDGRLLVLTDPTNKDNVHLFKVEFI